MTREILGESLEKLKANFNCMEMWRKSAELEEKIEKKVTALCPKRCNTDKYGVQVSIPYWLANDTLGTRQDDDKAMAWLTTQVSWEN